MKRIVLENIPNGVAGFPQRLRWAMNHAGLSQRKGAEKFGVSGRSLLYYMDGDRAPDIKVFAKIASDLEVSAAWLLNGEGTPGQS